MRLLRHIRGNPDTEYAETYPTAPPLDSTIRFYDAPRRRVAQPGQLRQLSRRGDCAHAQFSFSEPHNHYLIADIQHSDSTS